jgi:hypothetical protein
MKLSSRSEIINILGVTASLVILVAVIFVNSRLIASHEDARVSNFLKFWIAGHMVLTGQNPYDVTQWLDEHTRLRAEMIDDKIFLYPLPQAFFLVPFGLLPISESFLILGILSQVIIAATCFILLDRYNKPQRNRLFLPLVIFLMFFGPVYLSLQLGSIGAFALAVLVATILLLEGRKSILAGILLSTLVLKPSQGLPILFLFGCWLLFKRDWKVIIGLISGGLLLLLSGLIYDPQWIQKFLSLSRTVSDRNLGLQSNIFTYAYLGCNKNINCTGILGPAGILILLGLGSTYLWFQHEELSGWEALNFIVPIGFVSTIYLWSYDQILYILPIVWISVTLVEKTKSYLFTFIFLIVIDILSLIALVVQANTHKDILNIITTIPILVLCLWLVHTKTNAPIDKRLPAA